MGVTPPNRVCVSGLTKSYGAVQALAGASFQVREGEILAYLGPNGAGKTTTINILCGLLERDAGDVSICGSDPADDPVFVKSRIGLVSETSNLYPELTCRRNLEYLGELYGLARSQRKSRASELLELFGLADRQQAFFGTLSRGMQRRLTIAAALIHHPQVIFLDEPTIGLDVPSARALREHIRHINREGTTVLLTTHNLAEAESLADRVVILLQGRVAAEGTLAEIRNRVGRGRLLCVRFSGSLTQGDIQRDCPSVRSAMWQDDHWILEVENVHRAICEVASAAEEHCQELVGIDTSAVSLEEAFLSIIETNGQEVRGPS